MDEVIEMATLSSLIYAFHTEDYGNDDVNNTVCDRINHITNRNNNNDDDDGTKPRPLPIQHSIQNRTVPSNIHCEWYHHDWVDGTQVMILSSTTKQDIHTHLDPYIVIVFAGTDDMTTSLTDVDVLLSPFGYPKDTSNINTTIYPLYNVTLSDPKNDNIRVHTGFDSTLFNTRNLFGEIVTRVEQVRTRIMRPSNMAEDDDTYHHSNNETTTTSSPTENTNNVSIAPRIYTTGHSLGGGYSVLMAIGLTQYYESIRLTHSHRNHPSTIPTVPEEITVINFGCPQIGNIAFRDTIHGNNNIHHGRSSHYDVATSATTAVSSFPSQRLHIYRYVLGWDIVPRLPTLLQHVGHTIQLSTTTSTTTTTNNNNSSSGGSSILQKNITTAAYYHHLGNVTLQYASVPFGWSATPFIWIPGAVTAHYITAYIQCLLDLREQQQQQRGTNTTSDAVWITDFERSVPISNQTIYDDDYYIEPPNDDEMNDLTDTIRTTVTQ